MTTVPEHLGRAAAFIPLVARVAQFLAKLHRIRETVKTFSQSPERTFVTEVQQSSGEIVRYGGPKF
jgi:hypothetical protein